MNDVLARTLAASAVTLALTTLAACGGDGGTQVATDTSPSSATATPTPSPTVVPTVGTYPAYAVQDYSYTLEQQCFCANFGQAYRITVVDGEVTSVTWATEGDGHAVGDAVEGDFLRLTIQDIIDQANDTKAAKVEVDWPAGQDHPNTVYVDKDRMIADEEVTWVISDVTPA